MKPHEYTDSGRERVSAGAKEGSGTAKKSGRPAKSLLELVAEGSFRPNRNEELLASESLPEEPPFPLREWPEWYGGLLWAELRAWQDWYRLYRDAGDVDELDEIAREFSLLVKHLHGGRRPAFLTEKLATRGHDPDRLP